MNADQLRRAFVDFFVARDHTYRPSASLIPTDPTLLLNNAGMVPFKPFFLGEEAAPFRRAVSVQKCVRTIDIDIIGTTDRHLSFFEMLGNFSFGDYFKQGAIALAHEFVTDVVGIPVERLWYTVHESDDEAADIWTDEIGVPADRVQRGGTDNFWQMGVPGPCGPSSEIFVDRGPEHGHDGGPIGGGEDRFVEIWNLVFMQYVQDEPYHVVGDLPTRNIDTGMGLERLAMVMQGAASNFDTDLIRPILGVAEQVTGRGYGGVDDAALRMIADHARTTTMLIGDGVLPSNEGRGYVLRRIMRRAVSGARQLGATGPVMPALVEETIRVLGPAYEDLAHGKDFVLEVAGREEERFARTLESGLRELDAELADLGTGDSLDGEAAFRLHDTFGFPIELTTEIAAGRGVSVDKAGFDEAMSAQRTRARAAWKGGETAAREDAYRRILDLVGPTDFLGYDHDLATGRVLSMLADGEAIEVAEKGREVEVFLDRTPFYAESGGQVGDVGTITTATGTIAVTDTQHAVQGLHGHRGVVASGTVLVGQDVEATIDSPRRDRIRKAHTGTHVLYASLRQVVGDHVRQAGSLNEAGRLRFDFSHHRGLDRETIDEVERLSNERVIANTPVTTQVLPKDQALQTGAVAFFGDKYGEIVRVVSVGGYSKEFCGGTHVDSAGAVGPLVLVGESSIGANTRRLEAVVGDVGYQRISDLRSSLGRAAALLRTSEDEVPDRVEALLERTRSLETELGSVRDAQRGALATELVESAGDVGDHRVVVARRDLRPDELRVLALAVASRIGSGVVALAARNDGKGALVVVVSDDLVSRGVDAGAIAGVAAKEVGGGGSRDPRLAQAGGPNGDGVDRALEVAREAIARSIAD
jgi:alanyl-tRNA synthetase